MLELSPWLLSAETGESFTHCIECKLPLLEIDAPWLVTKHYRRQECILEYALCERCKNTALDLSEESKAAVRSFLESRIDLRERLAEFLMDPTLDTRTASCVACQTPRESMKGFCLSAIFDDGGKLMEGPLPLILCSDCLDEITRRLTPETLQSWQQFLARNFDGPPDETDKHPGGPGLPGLF